jgi:hypothetical protein
VGNSFGIVIFEVGWPDEALIAVTGEETKRHVYQVDGLIFETLLDIPVPPSMISGLRPSGETE